MNEVVKGDPSFSSTYDGRTYLFPGAEQKRMFDANPTAFVPALGGACTVCKVEKGKRVPGKAEFHTVHDGQLFLFPGEKQQKMFERDPHKYVDADLALGGACPVCLVKSNKVVPGRPEYASVYDGQRYLFPSPEQQQMFEAQPAAFVPAMHGNCSVCKVEKNEDVPGKAGFHLTHNGRLFLFPSQKQLGMFQANPDRYVNADVAMDGYCPVCKIEMGKDVKGKPDFAVDYEGKRYLFPGQKQLDMFKRDPVKYAVN
jgi:YHS domain-containing protein